MQLITCPDNFVPQDKVVTIFLAGGITGCPDWQSEVAEMLSDILSDQVHVFNPRRSSFDVSNPKDSIFQIEWEHHHLEVADIVLFWFPEETLCPITLFELGKCAARGKHLVIGTHPEYKRRLDVVHQLKLLDDDVVVYDKLGVTVNQLIQEAKLLVGAVNTTI